MAGQGQDRSGRVSEGLAKAHASARERRARGQKLSRRNPLEKSRAQPNSLRLAVSAKCYECVGGYQDPGFRAKIRNCGVFGCALHFARPYRDKNEKPRQVVSGKPAAEKEVATFTRFTRTLVTWLHDAHDVSYRDMGTWFECTGMCVLQAARLARIETEKAAEDEAAFVQWAQARESAE